MDILTSRAPPSHEPTYNNPRRACVLPGYSVCVEILRVHGSILCHRKGVCIVDMIPGATGICFLVWRWRRRYWGGGYCRRSRKGKDDVKLEY